MRFIIRDGFIVKTVTLVPTTEGQPPQVQENTYFARNLVDLDEQAAREHAHKLEPAVDARGKVDAEAKAFLDSLVVNNPAPPSNADIDRLVAEKVAQQLAAILGPSVLAQSASQVPAPGTAGTGA